MLKAGALPRTHEFADRIEAVVLAVRQPRERRSGGEVLVSRIRHEGVAARRERDPLQDDLYLRGALRVHPGGLPEQARLNPVLAARRHPVRGRPFPTGDDLGELGVGVVQRDAVVRRDAGRQPVRHELAVTRPA